MKAAVLLLAFLILIDFAAAAQCNASISVDSDAEFLQNGDKIEFLPRINMEDFDYIIEYWVEDSGGNAVKKKANTTNQNKKSFTPKNIENGIIIKARIAEISCDDINLEDNYAEKRIFLIGKHAENESFANKTIEFSFEIDASIEKLEKFAVSLNQNPGNITIKNPSSSKIQNSQPAEENKAKKALPYLFITLTTLLSVVLIWKR